MASSASSSKRPNWDALRKRVSDVSERDGALGHVVIKTPSEEELEDVGDDDDLTPAQIAKYRFFLCKSSFEAKMDEADNFVTCGQSNDGFMMFRTHHGNQVGILIGPPRL